MILIIFLKEERVVNSREYQCPCHYTRFIYKRAMLLENNVKFPSYTRYQDPPFVLEALIAARKIWITPDYTYCYRILDKRIKFSSSKVIYDIAQGILDMMKMSKSELYEKAQLIIIDSIMGMKNHFFAHIIHGNRLLYDIINDIGNSIMDDIERENYFNIWTLENIQDYVKKEKEKNLEYFGHIDQYSGVIIYGAGNYGKSVCVYIENRGEITFLGFAVSNQHPSGTARGYMIRNICDYIQYKDDALVIVAGKETINKEMKEYASDIGFRNILQVTQKTVDFENCEITDEQFAVY